MDDVFVILQVDNAQLDAVCGEAIDRAITNAEFVPRRIDRHDSGDLLKSETVQLIEHSQVDVTSERPNWARKADSGWRDGLRAHARAGFGVGGSRRLEAISHSRRRQR